MLTTSQQPPPNTYHIWIIPISTSHVIVKLLAIFIFIFVIIPYNSAWNGTKKLWNWGNIKQITLFQTKLHGHGLWDHTFIFHKYFFIYSISWGSHERSTFFSNFNNKSILYQKAPFQKYFNVFIIYFITINQPAIQQIILYFCIWAPTYAYRSPLFPLQSSSATLQQWLPWRSH